MMIIYHLPIAKTSTKIKYVQPSNMITKQLLQSLIINLLEPFASVKSGQDFQNASLQTSCNNASERIRLALILIKKFREKARETKAVE